MRHPDVRLVHCWGNLWPSLITDMASIPDAMVKPPVLSDAGYYSTGMVFDDILELRVSLLSCRSRRRR
jgi:hypothetical protein